MDDWVEKVVTRDLQQCGYIVERCLDHRKPYYDLMAYQKGSVSLYVDLQDRSYTPYEMEKFKELIEYTKGRAVKAHVSRFLGFFGLKVQYTIL